MTLPQEIIRAKRDGRELTAAEIGEFIAGLVSGAVSEGQAAAFAMAVFFRGMTLDERVALTRAMTLSGATIDWREANLPGPILDKHSTGGVGDNVSLMLAPMLAACGAYVPMISGRGLGHTGGTLDKLDSIPGYVSQPDLARFRRVVKEAGCAIIGQTADLAPADRRLYAIRDVTATVESVALITASILSKKLAAGLQGLVMDVKTGSGAFMPTLEASQELATSIAAVAIGAGLPTASLITDMNEPLASAAGNAVEVRNAVDYLTGEAPRRPSASGHARARSRVARSLGARQGRRGGARCIAESARFRRGGRAVRAHGRRARRTARISSSALTRNCRARRRSSKRCRRAAAPSSPSTCARSALRWWNWAEDARGQADSIDPAVGLTDLAPIGAEVGPDAPLARIHARSADEAEAAAAAAAGRLSARRTAARARRSGRRPHPRYGMSIPGSRWDATGWRGCDRIRPSVRSRGGPAECGRLGRGY